MPIGVYSRLSQAEQIAQRISAPNEYGCRLWLGVQGAGGYGMFHGKAAHRSVWILANGPIPPGLVIRHKCDVRLCVALEHLELGTQSDNVRDMVKRRRGRPKPTITLKCPTCGELFVRELRHVDLAAENNYCSNSCRSRAQARITRGAANRICGWCRKPFHLKASHHSEVNCCSRECLAAWQSTERRRTGSRRKRAYQLPLL